jgi:hypothetical protein
MVHHYECSDGLLSEINQVKINDRRNYQSKCLVVHAADMNNDMVFHDTSRGAANEEVLLDNGRNGADCAVSQDANMNNELMHSETSKREENKEAIVYMEFHDTSSSAVNEEVLTVDRRNGGGDCAVSQDTERNIKKVPYDTSRRKHNAEALMDEKGNDGDDYGEFQDACWNFELVPYDIRRREKNEVLKDSNYEHLDSGSQVNKIHKSKRQTMPLPPI